MKKKICIVAATLFAMIGTTGCEAIKNYDWSNWWTTHKEIAKDILSAKAEKENAEKTSAEATTTETTETTETKETAK